MSAGRIGATGPIASKPVRTVLLPSFVIASNRLRCSSAASNATPVRIVLPLV